MSIGPPASSMTLISSRQKVTPYGNCFTDINESETTMGTNETEEQEQVWNATAGRGWVEMLDVIDQALRPFEDLLVEAVGVGPGGRVLDVGCGTGGTTVAIARRLGAEGDCTGLDIAE